MWISGRRAVRPDRDIYRTLRRVGGRGRRGRPNHAVEIIGIIIVSVLSLIGWFFFR